MLTAQERPALGNLFTDIIKCDNPTAARLLVQRVMDSIYPQKPCRQNSWSEQELDTVISLINGINPKDTVELILASQFIALHLQGMTVMAQDYLNSKGHAMMLLRLSHSALDMLQKYRGKQQTITVNYNVLNQGSTILNAMTHAGDLQKNGG